MQSLVRGVSKLVRLKLQNFYCDLFLFKWTIVFVAVKLSPIWSQFVYFEIEKFKKGVKFL